ncbi:class I SAM-dependent methyltransferase [Actinokineospora soli]|uniref:Class I SAM-dependent methyltransferase n=1 Tax=Actinokineospora soli TaxID=1048753 RepID=A0ABW2TLE9_9PSEU
MSYSDDHAEFYDVVFLSRGKDWVAEAKELTGLVKARRPGADSVLDVACGTGAHLEAFAEHFAHVAGVEPADAMRRLAQDRPGVRAVHPGDMRDFTADRAYDAVTCLGFAVGYMPDEAALDAAIAHMARQLVPGGVLVVEPWWSPEKFLDGYVGGHLVREDGRAISRITHSVRDGDKSRMTIAFTVAGPGGVRQFHEVETQTLFTDGQYLRAFERAGCPAERVAGPPDHPGYLVGVRH